MLKKLSIFLLMVCILPLTAQEKRSITPKAPGKTESQLKTTPLQGPGHSTASADYIVVDTMANSFGPAISALNPLAYDPGSNVVAVVYRGKTTFAAGSGELWYSISTDMGATWSRVSGINSSQALAARYPSMYISNPTGGDISGTTALFSWPQLTPAAFGFVGYGADQPVGAGQPFSAIDQSAPGPLGYSSQVPNWASDNNSWVFWASDNQDDAGLTLWRTEDFGTIEMLTPPQWADSVFDSGGSITMGGASYNGVQYYGVVGTFNANYAPNAIASGWYPGYSKSTDNGATWSNWKVADFRDIPALAKYDRLYDYVKGDAFVSYHGDIHVDADGFAHLLVTVTDTTTDANSGINALVDIFETANGWDGKVVFEGITDSTFTKFDGPALGQMGPSGYLALNQDRNVLAATWVNGDPAAGDSICDIYLSYRSLSGDWSAPMNLTNSGLNENGSHLAPFLAQNGSDYTAFSMYFYEAGNTTHDIVNTNPTVIYVNPVTFSITGLDDNDALVNSFELSQNYPNPFNPSTSIKFTLAERSNVTLKVFDMLGREVSTLVNTTKEAGAHQVSFDASNLASGLYVYTLNAGNFNSSRKMMLLK